MKHIEFQPILIGKNQETIDRTLENWQKVTNLFNQLATFYKATMKEPLSISIVRQLLTEKPSQVERWLQIRFINNDPEYAKFLSRMKVDQAIAITNFPDFNDLIEMVNIRVKPHIYNAITMPEFDQWIDKSLVDGEFMIPDEMPATLDELHTHYTRNNRENLAVYILAEWAKAVNRLNTIGANISPRDLPRTLHGCFSSYSTGQKHSKLKYNPSCEPGWFIQHLEINHNLRNGESALLHLIDNLTDDQVNDWLAQLRTND